MKRLFIIPEMVSIISCSNTSSNKVASLTVDSDSVKITDTVIKIEPSVAPSLKDVDKLIGIWGTGDDENAAFEISKATFYYPEHNKYYKYKIVGDSIRIKYDDYNDAFAYKFKGNDTLIMNGMYGEQLFIRRK